MALGIAAGSYGVAAAAAGIVELGLDGRHELDVALTPRRDRGGDRAGRRTRRTEPVGRTAKR